MYIEVSTGDTFGFTAGNFIFHEGKLQFQRLETKVSSVRNKVFHAVKLLVSSVETNRFTARNTLFCYLF